MAFFGKLVAPDQEKKRVKPLQLLPISNTRILQRFEKTLVGRVLNLEAQENRVKALIGFLPTVWKCEGRVQGVEMGKGRFHFRFEEEADLQAVLDNRPYHFDGWMNALDRWVPTVRLDFPPSIPFWIRIIDLPDMYMEEKQVKRIGEDLGELLNWPLEEPYPMVQVMLECDAPLVMFRETVSEEGELFRIRFEYVKLQNHCTWCCRLTHESRHCPARLGPKRTHREGQQDLFRKREGEGDRRSKRGPRVEKSPPRRIREPTRVPVEAVQVQVPSPKGRPVRRCLTEELSYSLLETDEQRVAKGSTKEWIQKTFAGEKDQVGKATADEPGKVKGQASGSSIYNNSWYRNTEEEAKVAKLVYAQNEAWEKAMGGLRQSEMVEKVPAEDTEWRRKSQTDPSDGTRRAGVGNGGKEKKWRRRKGAG